jgi:hypothetical protein
MSSWLRPPNNETQPTSGIQEGELALVCARTFIEALLAAGQSSPDLGAIVRMRR